MMEEPWLKERARKLRRNMSPAEKILWSILPDRRLAGFKFRRQHPIGAYVLDFFCCEMDLSVELDGATHLGKETADRNRQQWLESAGIRVLRFWNNDVFENRDAVLEAIWQECEQRRRGRALTPDPSPRGRGEKGVPSP